MFRHLIERWKNWVGDAELERAIRDELVRQGFPRQGSQLRGTHLYAIQRPGYVQVWSFEVDTQRGGLDVHLYGAARDDTRNEGRQSAAVIISSDPIEVEQQLAQWSEGLIVRRR